MSDWLEQLSEEERVQWDTLVASYQAEIGSRMAGAPMYVMVFEADTLDAKQAMELGTAVMLGKPIIVAAKTRTFIPTKLLDVADEIVRADASTEVGQREITRAIVNMMQEVGDAP